MRTITLVSLALLTLSAGALAQEKPRRDQDVSASEVRDHGYLFRLRRPGSGWQLMGGRRLPR